MKKSIFVLLLALCISPLFAAYNSLGVPDSSEIREQLIERWFEAPLSAVRENMPEVYYNEAGQKFQVRLEETADTFNIFVSPSREINVAVYSSKGTSMQKQEVFPGEDAGSFVLVRDKKTGKALKIRYYFLKNSDVFIQFTPSTKTALADMVIYGNYAARGVPTGIPFTKFYEISFEDIMKVTQTKLPWNYVTPDVNRYHSVMQMIAVIKERLPFIMIANDAMYDEHNDLVHITTGKEFDTDSLDENKLYLSSAGFLKWIADGIVEPIAGGRLKREPLIKETVTVKNNGHQGVLSQKYNLYFGLDWIRNLASAVISVQIGKNYLFNQSGVDVTINPFASSVTSYGVENTVTFIEDSGYNASVLKSLLYILASTEPGNFYFGAIRTTDRTVTPEVKYFGDCCAFFPYFLEDGSFQCTVFINGRQMVIDDFLLQHADDFVYLTRVKSDERFFPN